MYYYLIDVLQLNWTPIFVTISGEVTLNKAIIKQHQYLYDKYEEQWELNKKLVDTLQASGVVLKTNKNTDELQGMVHKNEYTSNLIIISMRTI